MKVRWEPARIRQTNWKEYAIRFGFGGLVTALTGFIAHRYGPEVCGLFLAFPAILPATVTLIEGDEGRRPAAVDAAGALLGSAGLMAFAGIVWGLGGRAPAWKWWGQECSDARGARELAASGGGSAARARAAGRPAGPAAPARPGPPAAGRAGAEAIRGRGGGSRGAGRSRLVSRSTHLSTNRWRPGIHPTQDSRGDPEPVSSKCYSTSTFLTLRPPGQPGGLFVALPGEPWRKPARAL
jgi:hypothetical protein